MTSDQFSAFSAACPPESARYRACLSGASFVVPDHLLLSAWIQHAPFAFWLTEVLQPRVFVELGTDSGLSYFTFCQAVNRSGAPTRCFGVDTWREGEHAGFHGDDGWNLVFFHNAERFSSFSTLLRSTFADAVPQFGDGTIDLLHIDGRHFYEDVKQDFEMWRPKLAPNAVVLFHNTNVRERDFSVYRLWEELRGQHPSFEFLHGNGLGVLAVGRDVPAPMRSLFELSDDPTATATLRRAYARLGQALSDRFEQRHSTTEAARLIQETAARQVEIERLGAHVAAQRAELEELVGQVDAERQRIGAGEAEVARLRNELSEAGQQAEIRESTIGQLCEQTRAFHERETALQRALDDLRRDHAAALNSNSYRAFGPLRRWAERHPKMRRPLSRLARVTWGGPSR